MIEEQHTSPVAWLQAAALTLQWPLIVAAAFWLGRYVQKLEERVERSESYIRLLVERHMPAIHKMLAEIRGLLVAGR